MSKSKIRFGIGRKIKTAEFEQLDVTGEVMEEIEWKGEKERDKKIQQVIKHLIGDFKKTYSVVAESIGLKRTLGSATLTKKDGSKMHADVASDDGELDMFGDD